MVAHCENIDHRVITMVAVKLKRLWLWEVYFRGYQKGSIINLAQFILQPQHTDNPQNICEGVITNALQSCSKEVVTISKIMVVR